MTVIAIRDGIMAVDSLIAQNGRACGEMIKWREVPPFRGGGYVAASGEAALAAQSLDNFLNAGGPADDGVVLIHLKADGSVALCESKAWFSFSAPFHAEGSGAEIALAAMHAGASAEEAVKIAAKMRPSECGGTVHVLRVGEK